MKARFAACGSIFNNSRKGVASPTPTRARRGDVGVGCHAERVVSAERRKARIACLAVFKLDEDEEEWDDEEALERNS